MVLQRRWKRAACSCTGSSWSGARRTTCAMLKVPGTTGGLSKRPVEHGRIPLYARCGMHSTVCFCSGRHHQVWQSGLLTHALPADYTAPSGERYVLDTDIPKGHVTLTSAMIPSDKGTTVYDWMFDSKTAKWKLWESILDDTPPTADAEVRSGMALSWSGDGLPAAHADSFAVPLHSL